MFDCTCEQRKNNKKIYFESILFSVICTSLFCYGFMYPILSPDLMFVVIGSCVIGEFIIKKHTSFDVSFFVLCEAMIICSTIEFHTNIQYMYEMKWAWIIPVGYILGSGIALDDEEKSNYRIIVAMGSLTVGMGLQGFIDFTCNFIPEFYPYEGVYLPGRWLRFWTHEMEARNTFSLELIFLIAALPWALKIIKERKVISYTIIVLNVLIQLLAIKTRSRTLTCLFVVIMIWYLFKEKFIHNTKKHKIIIGIVCIITLMMILAAYKLIQYWVPDFYWNKEGGIIRNIRVQVYIEFFKEIVRNPLGGFKVDVLLSGYTHSLWTEYGRVYGLVVFVLLVIFLCLTIRETILLQGDKLHADVLLKSSFIIINIYYALEPNAFQYRYFWFFGLFVCGLIKGKNEVMNENTIVSK